MQHVLGSIRALSFGNLGRLRSTRLPCRKSRLHGRFSEDASSRGAWQFLSYEVACTCSPCGATLPLPTGRASLRRSVWGDVLGLPVGMPIAMPIMDNLVSSSLAQHSQYALTLNLLMLCHSAAVLHVLLTCAASNSPSPCCNIVSAQGSVPSACIWLPSCRGSGHRSRREPAADGLWRLSAGAAHRGTHPRGALLLSAAGRAGPPSLQSELSRRGQRIQGSGPLWDWVLAAPRFTLASH